MSKANADFSEGFTMIDNRFIIDKMPGVSAPAVKVYVALARRGRESWPSLSRLQVDTGLSRPTVVNATAELRVAGLLEISAPPPGRESNTYRIVSPPTGKKALPVRSLDRTGKKALPDRSKRHAPLVKEIDPNKIQYSDSATRNKKKTQIGAEGLTEVFLNGAEAENKSHDLSFEVGTLDWQQVERELPKLLALLPTRTDADYRFLVRVTMLAQTGRISESALRDALGTVKAKRKELGNTTGYFRSVLRDNCHKAGVVLDSELKQFAKLPKCFSSKSVAQRTPPASVTQAASEPRAEPGRNGHIAAAANTIGTMPASDHPPESLESRKTEFLLQLARADKAVATI
jgi:hypothetical protein